jgi:hypothetical protein
LVVVTNIKLVFSALIPLELGSSRRGEKNRATTTSNLTLPTGSYASKDAVSQIRSSSQANSEYYY